MKKLVLLTVGLLFALQLVAVAKDNDKGKDKDKKPEPPNAGNVYKHIEKEEHDSDDISPVHGKGHPKKDNHDDNRNHDKH